MGLLSLKQFWSLHDSTEIQFSCKTYLIRSKESRKKMPIVLFSKSIGHCTNFWKRHQTQNCVEKVAGGYLCPRFMTEKGYITDVEQFPVAVSGDRYVGRKTSNILISPRTPERRHKK